MQVIVAMIDRDYLFKKGDDPELDRRGTKWTGEYVEDIHDAPRVRFRCKDDDGIIYFGGWLRNDDACKVQSKVLEWTQRDAGCTTIEVKDPDTNEWVQDIG
jgi:hypothetical protein